MDAAGEMRARAHADDAGARGGLQVGKELAGKQESGEVVHGELKLDPVRALPVGGAEDSRVVHQDIEMVQAKADTAGQGSDLLLRGEVIRRLNAFLTPLARRMRLRFPETTEREIACVLIQMMSAIMLPGIMPGLFKRGIGIDLRDKKARAQYVDLLANRAFQRVPGARRR